MLSFVIVVVSSLQFLSANDGVKWLPTTPVTRMATAMTRNEPLYSMTFSFEDVRYVKHLQSAYDFLPSRCGVVSLVEMPWVTVLKLWWSWVVTCNVLIGKRCDRKCFKEQQGNTQQYLFFCNILLLSPPTACLLYSLLHDDSYHG